MYPPYTRSAYAIASELLSGARLHGGATVRLDGLPVPADGFLVGHHGIADGISAMRHTRVTEWVRGAKVSGAAYVGSWLDNGTLYLDVSTWHATEAEALAVGAARGELAVFDLAHGKSVDVPNVRVNTRAS